MGGNATDQGWKIGRSSSMADAWSTTGEILKWLGGGIAGWFLHVAKEQYVRKELRSALYRELANNYSSLLYNCGADCNFDWLRHNLAQHLSFHAYTKVAANPEAFYRIPEHGWFERCFKELQQCTALPPADEDLMEQLTRTTATIEGICPPADTEKFQTLLPKQHATHIK
jgi:hypothetical protein